MISAYRRPALKLQQQAFKTRLLFICKSFDSRALTCKHQRDAGLVQFHLATMGLGVLLYRPFKKVP